jgi:NAD(P)-dependent dehydrogenase (short-subunit alcohol dehydrogenase family)
MPNPTLESIFSLAGQVAIITGGSRGIGRGIAEIFGAAGARLALVARDPARLAETADRLRGEGYEVLDCPADVAVEAQVHATVQRVIEDFGQVDILVNNAGILQAGPIGNFTAADWERMIATNLTSVFYFCRAVAPLLSAQRSGRIINIASITGQTGGVSGGVHYSASKGGMLALTKTLARDLAPYNVTVNAICPGQIETDTVTLTPEARRRLEEIIPLGRIGRPEDIAQAALFLASAAASYITGAAIDVNGGLLKR